MSFKDMPFGSRFNTMGDASEEMFQRVWPDNFERFGLNRPKLNVGMLPSRIRHMPDMITSRNLIEIKGVGKDDLVKLKVLDLNCLAFWNQVHPVRIFVWSSHRWAWTIADLPDVQRMIDLEPGVVLDRFHDGRAFFALPGDLFCWTELDKV